MAAPRTFQHLSQAQSGFKPPLISNDNCYLGDVFSSEKDNSAAPTAGGLFRLEAGQPLTYTYNFDEHKIILEGEFEISDSTGKAVKALPGDILYIPTNTTLTFKTSTYGLAYYVAQRKQGEL
ncbi:ethanolamine utilization protein [Penicillium cataractarum]|uniref:Ethanolamine utilization protein n=1 Tax=Penicillium cataractarum TaxID=2100454 RepID=A0A9W9RQE3_9EURO|nr:ethanolamine utilization protein [Penicillium cataractarum]KAJ5364492.1 ethanolamine utilization protein [Penicillium cataractarum]